MLEFSRNLPQTVGERVALGVASLIFGVIFGGTALILFLTPLPPLGILVTVIVILLEHLSLATALVAVLGIIWAVFMPPWVERLYRIVWRKLFLLMAIGCALVAALCMCVCLGRDFRL
jgi:hypothetical protein